MRIKSSLGVSSIVSMAVITTSFAACKDKESDALEAFHELQVEVDARTPNGQLTILVDGVVKCVSREKCEITVERDKVALVRIETDGGFTVDRWYSPEDRYVAGCEGSALSVELRPSGISYDNATKQRCVVALKKGEIPLADAGTDAQPDGSTGTASPGGLFRALVGTSGVYAEAAFDMSEADVLESGGAHDQVMAAEGLAPGKCTQGPYTAKQKVLKAGKDVGALDLKDGATKLLTLMPNNNGLYAGNVNGTTAFGKTLDLVSTNPAVFGSITGFIHTPTASLTVTEPTGTDSVVMRSSPMQLAWNPFTVDTFIVFFAGNPPMCRLDPTAGTFTVPAEITALLKPGTFQSAVFQAVNRRVVDTTINGAPRSIRAYTFMNGAATYTVQ